MSPTRRTLLAAVAALSITSLPIPLPSIAPATAAPTQITDAFGRTVTVEVPVRRVVNTFYFEEFTAVAGVEGWQRVVGMSRTAWQQWRRSIYDRYVQVIPNLATVPDVGLADDNTFSVEKIVALQPDVVLVSSYVFGSLKPQIAQLEAVGIPTLVLDYNAQLLDRHLLSTRIIGRIMGTEARAEELAQFYESRYRAIVDRIAAANLRTRPKAYVEIGQNGPEATGLSYATTMWGKILTNLGADNIAVGKLAGPSGPLSPESVIAADPDVIFFAGSSWPNRPKAVKTGYDATPAVTRASLAPYAERPGWGDIPAIRTGNVNAIEHGLCRALFDIVAYEYMAKRLYPDLFADLDPEASFKAYHERFLPVSYGGTWMLPLKP